MKKIELEDTNQLVSPICLGTAYYGNKIDKENSFKLMDKYYELGGRFLDTANSYAGWIKGGKGGDSERVIGEWLKERKNRKEIFIGTKVGFGYGNVKQGLNPDTIISECEKSLINLGVECIDLYYAHLDDRSVNFEEVMFTLDKLVKDGKVKNIGASNYRAWRLEEARNISLRNSLKSFCCVQNHFTYLQLYPGQDVDDYNWVRSNKDHFDFAKTNKVSIIAHTSLMWGAYNNPDKSIWNKYKGEHSEKRMSALHEISENTGASPNQVVIAWMMQHDPQIIPVIGASNVSQIEDNMGACELNLSKRQLRNLHC